MRGGLSEQCQPGRPDNYLHINEIAKVGARDEDKSLLNFGAECWRGGSLGTQGRCRVEAAVEFAT